MKKYYIKLALFNPDEIREVVIQAESLSLVTKGLKKKFKNRKFKILEWGV